MSSIDALFITPRSRLEVYQGLSNDYAAIEPPVWSSLIANYLLKRNYNVKILDAEAENLTHEETAEKILKLVCYGTGPIGNIPGRFETIDETRKKLKHNGLKVTANRIAKTWFVEKNKANFFYLCKNNAFKQVASICLKMYFR